MSRNLKKQILLAPVEVTIVGDATPESIAAAALAQGGQRIFIEDAEKRPETPEELLVFIDADIPASGQVRALFTAQAGDALTKCRGFLAAVEADGRAAATNYKNRRAR